MPKKLLAVIDYQNDFVSGSLGFPGAAELEDRIADKILRYKEEGHDVIFTLDTHTPDYLDTREGRFLPVPHCLEGAQGWKLYGKVASLCDPSTPVFTKRTFGSMAFAQFLQERNYDEIEFVGVVSNICVLSNAVLAQAALPEATITIHADYVASNDAALHEKALTLMQHLHMDIIGP
ncbi:MAG: cysteine hydrolase family protein [Christensenellales bacterium]|jgi:nicotinamidase/pyrazinamidase